MDIACFEKVSYEQFEKDSGLDKNIYEDIKLPYRKTYGSAGHDFMLPMDVTLKPNEQKTIPTGIACDMLDGWVLQIYPRSSLGFKYGIGLVNTVGIIDKDYYYAENGGHIMVKIKNNGDEVVNLKKGTSFCQGLFIQYGSAYQNEELQIRTGGFGSTD